FKIAEWVAGRNSGSLCGRFLQPRAPIDNSHDTDDHAGKCKKQCEWLSLVRGPPTTDQTEAEHDSLKPPIASAVFGFALLSKFPLNLGILIGIERRRICNGRAHELE